MATRLLIFDWDGTLADSAATIVATMQAAIRELALPARDDETIRDLIGLGMNDVLQRLFPELEQDGLHALLEHYRRHWLSEIPGEAPLFAGALESLQALHLRGHALAVATGKSRRGLDRSLRHHAALAPLFHVTRCADETASKPDPRMLREILADRGLAADEALMVGDTEYDMAMARAIGMPALGVVCGVHQGQRLRAAGAVALVDDVAALPAWLAAAQGSG